MQLVRPAIALDPRRFGRGAQRQRPAVVPPARLGEDIKLFAMTFLTGFVFVSIFLA